MKAVIAVLLAALAITTTPRQPAAEDPLAPLDRLSIENIPAGWRARETYRFRNAEEFEEVFELSEPGKTFDVYSCSRFKRVK